MQKNGEWTEFLKTNIETSFPQHFEYVVHQHPHRLAVRMRNNSMTYNDLNELANRIARAILQKRGRGSEPIAILIGQDVKAIAALLGISKAGKFYIPLDPSFPRERNSYMVNDTQAALIITNHRNAELAEQLSCDSSVIIDVDDIRENAPCGDLNLSVSLDDLFAVVYTSGSTGEPRGVRLTHRQRTHDTMLHSYMAGICASDRLSLLQPAGAVAAEIQLFRALYKGAGLFLYDVRADGIHRLGNWLRDEQITVFHTTPAVFRQLSDLISDRNWLSSLRLIHLSGAPITKADFGAYKEKYLANCKLAFHMGSTEGGAICTAIVNQEFSFPETGAPVGYPYPTKAIVLLDDEWRQVGIGGIGEIAVKSRYLAEGYWRNPDLTAAKFIPDPDGGNDRVYLTGDLGRMLPDGFLLHFGRKDFMVKIRGNRVELGEIEKALLVHPQVKDAAVQIWDRGGDTTLAAYVVPKTGSTPTVSTLREFLAVKLPDYMIPSAFTFLDSLPLTNGKVDRKSLPKPDDARPELTTRYAAPRNEVEKSLVQIWEGVLDVRAIGIHDNFFELGGHSLAAMRVVAEVVKRFQLETPLQFLLQSPTVAEMAVVIAQAQQRKEGVNTADFVLASSPKPLSRNQPLDLSFAQQRLWFLNQLDADSPVYNEPKTLRVRGPLNFASLDKAFQALVARHEVLRTTYRLVDGMPTQVIHAQIRVELVKVDLSGLPITEQEKELQRCLTEKTHRPFKLQKELPVRGVLIRLGKNEHIFLLVTHHIASDGWSSVILLRELAMLYGAFCQGKPSPLKNLPIHYADYAVWQKQWLQGEVLERQLSYWKKQLQGITSLQLPTDRPRPSVLRHNGNTLRFTLSQKLTRELKASSREEGVTLFMTLLAAFQTLLHRYAGQVDISVGVPTAGRSRREMEELVGVFINTLVLRSNLSGNPTFRKLLAQVKRNAIDAYSHQDLPFEKIVRELQLERDLNRNPLFQVMFQLRNYPKGAFSFAELTVEEYEFESGIAKFDLSVGLREENEGLSGAIEYNTELFDRGTIERMVGHYQTMLEGIVADPNQKLSDLPLITEPEKHQLLIEWNDTQTDYPKDKCIHELFEQQVEKTPDAVAVVFEDKRLTYRELNQRSNQLAHYLKKRGVGPEVLVGISLEPSIDLVVGLLAILKAGGAYVPLDPNYPMERLAFMLKDASANLLLTEQKMLGCLPKTGGLTLCLDQEQESIATQSNENPGHRGQCQDLAYVIYTSGSTGIPKGVMIPHRALVNNICAVAEHFAMSSADRRSQFASPSFDVFAAELFTPLSVGACVVLGPKTWFASISEFSRFVRDYSVTVVSLPTAFWHEWVTLLASSEALIPSTLRLVIVGTEEASAEHYKLWKGLGKNRPRWCNAYGPTEATITTTIFDDPCDDAEFQTVPIGRPIGNTQVYLLDAYLNPVPIGVAGELFIGGSGLARGYLNRPDLTAEKFIANPFINGTDQRLYRTGDIGRYREDGTIEFLGRIDDQVKIRGFRIELGEVEAVIGQHPAVDAVAVLVREYQPGNRQLVAYVGSKQQGLAAEHLRSFARQTLPGYMVPVTFVMMRQLPLNPNGKVDRNFLASMLPRDSKTSGNKIGPRNPIEQALVMIWADVLGLKEIGVHDDFFDLGGHSIIAIRLVNRIRQRFSLELPVRLLFELRTIEQMALELQCLRRDGTLENT